jgi:DnaJ like chaperone protein
MYKWIGLIIGFMGMGFLGGFLGYLLGGLIDRASNYGIGGINPLSASERQAIFMETVFVLMGKLAKADGHISRAEIDHVELFIKKMGMSEAHRQQAIQQFKRGADQDYDINPLLDNFLRHCGNTLNLKQVLLSYLTVIALADGRLDAAEQRLIEQVGMRLGYSVADIHRILDMVSNQSHFSQPRQNSQSALADAYKALGVSADSSDQQVKRAYRKLMSQHHPDKLMGQGVPEDMIAVATEQAKEIQLAYDLIKKHRDSLK